ncbi:MAG: TonB-dependent receptor family protein [Ignavibacteriaceae bacterium]|nr:TonB-dependent receptor family protein [Ignavibacteriaceae bacterium]
MRNLTLYLIFFCSAFQITTTTFAQTDIIELSKGKQDKGIISGIVVDSATTLPIVHASFQLFNKNDTSRVLNVETTSNGKFILKDVPLGSYSAQITTIGYKKRKRDLIVFTEKVKVIDLDTIRLAAKDIYMNEMVISEKYEGVYKDNEKIVVRVNKDLGNNGIEVLENIPMVNVDIDGNVNLAGKENTKIYIDGIPMDMSGFLKPEELRHLSVTDIEKIEIITSHSIDYIDAGNSGIINIVTKKKLDNKYTGSASLGGNTKSSYNADANLSYIYESLIMRGSHKFNNSDSKISRTSLKSIILNDSIGYLEQTSDNHNNYIKNDSRINVLYNPDKKNSLTAGIIYNDINTTSLLSLLTDQRNNSNNVPSESKTTADKNIKQNFLMLMTSYRRTFSKRNEYFNVAASYNNNEMNTTTTRRYEYSSLADPIRQNDFSDNSNNNMNWRTRYATPLIDNINLALGYSGNFTELNMKNDYYNYDPITDSFMENISSNNHFKNRKMNHSLSGYVSSKIINIDIMAGINYETFITKFDEFLLRHSFQKQYSNFLPDISLSTSIDKNQSINFKWSLNYIYPQNRQINPYADYSDSTNVTVGNPDLAPSLGNLFTAGYMFYTEGTIINSSIFYYMRDNGIEEITEQYNLTKAITTFKNIYSTRSYGLSLSANTELFNFLTINPSLRWTNRKYEGATVQSSGSSLSIYLSTYFAFKDFRFQINSYYSAPEYSAQTKSNANYFVDAAMRCLFFDRSLSVSIKAKDIFNLLSQNSTSYGYGFSSSNSMKEKTQIFSLDISYYFNIKGKEDIEERKDTEEYNDDF